MKNKEEMNQWRQSNTSPTYKYDIIVGNYQEAKWKQLTFKIKTAYKLTHFRNA